MSIARGWGQYGYKHRYEDDMKNWIAGTMRILIRDIRKEKIKRIFNVSR